MFRVAHITALFAALLSLCFIAVVHADEIDNPAYQNWAKFKPGTSVTLSSESEAMGNKTTTKTTTTLKDLTPDKATIELKVSMVVAGSNMDMPAQTQDIPAKIQTPAAAAPAPAADAPKPEQGSEDVAAGGKTYSCKTAKITTDQNGMKTTAETWTCDDVPGNVVKMESSTSGSMTSTTKMILVACDIKS